MKESRTRDGQNSDKPNNTEWYLKMYVNKNLKYDGWYNPGELIALEECIVKRPTLMTRLYSKNESFNTVEKCLTATKFNSLSYQQRSKCIKEKILAKQKNQAYLIKDLTYTLMLLWPKSTVHKKARILNSK